MNPPREPEMAALLPPLSITAQQPQSLSPTDLAQYLRLDQCQRHLRLRMHERRGELQWLPKYGISLQAIPPMLTIAGRAFEQAIEQQVLARFPAAIHCAQRRQAGDPAFLAPDHNHIVAQQLRSLTPGTKQALFQPRLAARFDAWHMSGDVDLLALECDERGALHALIVDAKSSATAKIEHRLQLACYQHLLEAIVADAGITLATIELGVLYRGEPPSPQQTPAERQRIADEQRQAETRLGVTTALLEVISDPAAYLAEIDTLLRGDQALAATIARAPFAELPFHLTAKCDGCIYNEICMRWAAEYDDLSLIPSLTEPEKSALRARGVTTTVQLATLKELADNELVTPAHNRDFVAELARQPTLAARLDELIHRARAFRRWRGDQITALPTLPYRGYSSMPAVNGLNPDLIAIYLDPLYDHTKGMLVMLGALVIGHRDGQPVKRRVVIERLLQPPQALTDEAQLLERWIDALLKAVFDVASPDAEGRRSAPIHLIVPDSFSLRILLDGLGRHPQVFGSTPLYDLAAQGAGFEAPMVTVLLTEWRRFRNDPLAHDSLLRLARLHGFDWGECRRRFYRRVFDDLGNDQQLGWYTRRVRFNNQIPLEYVYAAWQALPPPPQRGNDDLVDYRQTEPKHLITFMEKRLEAFALLAGKLPANTRTSKPPFDLTCIATYQRQARALADALAEFLLIERYVALVTWGQQHLPPPPQRALAGVSLIVQYRDADQDPQLLETLRENERRQQLKEELTGGKKRARLTAEQRAATHPLPLPDDISLRLRLESAGTECDVATILHLTSLAPGERVILAPYWSIDDRQPEDQRAPFMTTARQLLYQPRATLVAIEHHDQESFVVLKPHLGYSRGDGRFTFSAGWQWPRDGEQYTIEPDPNDIYGQRCMEVVAELRQGAANALAARVASPNQATVTIPPAVIDGQRRFADGLRRLAEEGLFHSFDAHQMAYIADHGDAATLLVQGPPGTGKSYTSAFALLARMQGMLAAAQECRIVLSCKTHAATDVLLRKIADVQRQLAAVRERHPDLFAQFFDERLIAADLFRVRPRDDASLPEGVKRLTNAEDIGQIMATPACFVAATPFAVAALMKREQRYHNEPFADLLALDEASQMNLPEACMAGLALRPNGRLIVVGDHRQMPPIVQHEWNNERRRTFQAYRVYASLFETLMALDPAPPIVRLAESFRLHRAIAEFLRRAIYQRDGIHYFSRRDTTLKTTDISDDLVNAALTPTHPLIVIVHDEAQSQDVNPVEIELITPLVKTLVEQLNLDAASGIGVVVPHRAQRLALRNRLPEFMAGLEIDHDGATIDTVERFQGDERDVIIVSATESDPDYLRATAGFLLDPRRLNVALSRARHKLILIAARTVFQFFAADEETFQHAQLWKQLLRDTCRQQLWSGERAGVKVEVWGNSTSNDSPGLQ